MERRVREIAVIAVLIAALLSCPYFCRAGVGGCCAGGPRNIDTVSASACTAECCRHLDKSPSNVPAPLKTPCENTCLCKGALPDVGGFDLDAMLSVWCHIDGTVNDAVPTARFVAWNPLADSPLPLAGRALRAEVCSWLC
jgi:hypothetical protein